MDNGDLLSLLGSLITAYIALNIFGKWKSQKGSEVISIHAKEIFILIEELPKNMNIVMEDMLAMVVQQKVPNDFKEERYNDFMYKNLHIIKMLKLIKFNNRDKKTVELIDKFEDSYKGFATFYKKLNPTDLDLLLESKDVYEQSFKDLKEEMYKYTLFKKTI